MMPVYYFHLQSGDSVTEDPDGTELPDLQMARQYAVFAAKELLAHALMWGRKEPPDRVFVLDEEGRELLTVFMTDVLPNSLKKHIR